MAHNDHLSPTRPAWLRPGNPVSSAVPADRRILPVHVSALVQSCDIAPQLLHLVPTMEGEVEELIASLGGRENLSAQRLLLVEDTAYLGLIARATMARWLQAADRHSPGLIGSTINSRRRQLVALGLDEYRQERDLDSFLRDREARKAKAFDVEPESDHDEAVGSLSDA